MERQDRAKAADEKTSLTEFLDFQRATMLWKAGGLTSEQASMQAIPTTSLTLAGVLKHLALVEDHWFQRVFKGDPLPEPWASAPFDDDPDWEFHTAITDDISDTRALYEAAGDRSRAVQAGTTLDSLSVGLSRDGEPFSMRWIMLHVIEETARHAGHADLLREAIDGETGE